VKYVNDDSILSAAISRAADDYDTAGSEIMLLLQPTLTRAAHLATVRERRLAWTYTRADECISAAMCEMACKLRSVLPTLPDRLRAIAHVTGREATHAYLDEMEGPCCVPRSSARRGARPPRGEPFNSWVEAFREANRDDQRRPTGREPRLPRQRRSETYWRATEALVAAAVELAPRIDNRLRVAVAAMLDGACINAAAIASGVDRRTLIRRFRELGRRVAATADWSLHLWESP
jgi:hypothetical protein